MGIGSSGMGDQTYWPVQHVEPDPTPLEEALAARAFAVCGQHKHEYITYGGDKQTHRCACGCYNSHWGTIYCSAHDDDALIAAAKAAAVEPLLHTLDQARSAWMDVISNLPSMESNIESIRRTAERERRWAEEAAARALSTSEGAERG